MPRKPGITAVRECVTASTRNAVAGMGGAGGRRRETRRGRGSLGEQSANLRRPVTRARRVIESMAMLFDLAPDLGIDRRGREDARAGMRRVVRRRPRGALGKAIGFSEQARDDLASSGRGAEDREEKRPHRRQLRASQLQRQIDPSGPRILADVARNVGELHGDAKIAGARERRGRAHAHQQRHHRADGAATRAA